MIHLWKMATMFLCFSVLRSISLAYSLFFFIWVIRCSVGATYTVAFSFAVLCQLFTFSVICYFRYAVLYFLWRCWACYFFYSSDRIMLLLFFMMLSLSPQAIHFNDNFPLFCGFQIKIIFWQAKPSVSIFFYLSHKLENQNIHLAILYV